MHRVAVLLIAALPSISGFTPAVPRAPLHPAPTGRIAGTVQISAALASRRAQFRIYNDARAGSVAPRVPPNELTTELRNVVVYLQTEGTPPARTPSATRVMAQADERFDPHVLPIRVGERVEFPNYDDIYHNVFSLSRARTFDLGRYPKGASKSVTFSKPGVVQVYCHIHADMSAIVLVLTNDHFARPDTTGSYAIENVPPGEYTVTGWHERTRPVTQRIRVIAGQTTAINFTLPLGETSGQ